MILPATLFYKKIILTNRSRVKDPHFLAKKQQKMAIFEKTEYWGLKDPLEVRVQHGTCIYMGDTFSSHFEPKKFDRVDRRGQKQPKLGIFEGTNIATFGCFWLLLPTRSDFHGSKWLVQVSRIW